MQRSEASADSRVPLLAQGANLPNLSLNNVRPAATAAAAARAVRPLPPPVPRQHVGPLRLKCRDEWNLQELRIGDALAKKHYDRAEGLSAEDIRAFVRYFYGEEPREDEMLWIIRLATRGKTRCNRVEQLHYALRAYHARQNLPPAVMRLLATATMGSQGNIDPALLREWLKDLNQSNDSVSESEVSLVLQEAEDLASGNRTSRADLLRAISAWYLNIVRKDTPLTVLLMAWYGRWMPEHDYHKQILGKIRASFPKRDDGASPNPSGSNVMKLVNIVALGLALLCPTIFFAWMIYLGAEHGDDRCPRDLDGLITWFGILGLASVAMGFISNPKEPYKAHGLSICLKVVLLFMPWLGASWTFHLGYSDQTACGPVLMSSSAFVWTSLILLEVLAACAFCWGVAVTVEHEQHLQLSLGQKGTNSRASAQDNNV